MKDQIRIIAIIIGVIILVAEVAYSKTQAVPKCELENSISKQNFGMKLNFSELPKVVFIARESIQEILGQQSMIVSRQTFVQPHSKVECANFAKQNQKNYSIIVPVLIDLTTEQKTKNSYWQFQSMVYENKIGIWNQKTKLIGVGFTIEEWLKTQKSEVEFFQINHEQIMLQIRQKLSDQVLTQRIYFDIIAN